ncbi:hypothetical protein ASA1KI_33830 [Opitutales bacterium ASA1]|nr:hypothetical protein ASA1KI_33830 [Opitutales bacterium ASA1]
MTMGAHANTRAGGFPAWFGGWGSGTNRPRNPWRVIVEFFVPPRGQKVLPTRTGIVFVMVSIGIGIAAYNTASNILFITLSLLLAALVLGGILSWLNFRRCAWRVCLQPPLRVGETAVVGLDVYNGKRVLPTYSLVFNFKTSGGESGQVGQRSRLDPGTTRRLEWSFRPSRRGRELVEMSEVTSQFPFGILLKSFGGRVAQEVRIWPERIDYRADPSLFVAPESVGDPIERSGEGSEFAGLRGYKPGDPMRSIHWKATARQRRMIVRETLAEHDSGFVLHLQTLVSVWRRPEQFERLCSLASTLAEDLFRRQRLQGAWINDAPPVLVRRMSDLEIVLDQIAVLEPVEQVRCVGPSRLSNLVRFEPDDTGGVHVYIRGQKAASA